MAEVKLQALGLREVNFSDYDRYLTALTREGRLIEIFHKNARRGKRQMPAARLFCWSEFILSERGGRYSLREADLLHSFFGLTADINQYALACYLAELSFSLAEAGLEQPALCRLLLNALYRLERGRGDESIIRAAFEWRAMAESGYAPQLAYCGVCGNRITAPPVWFSVAMGQAADPTCAQRIGGWTELAGATLRALCHVLTAEPDKVFRFTLTGPAKQQFCTLAEQYVQYHLDRTFDSLHFYRQIKNSKNTAGKQQDNRSKL